MKSYSETLNHYAEKLMDKLDKADVPYTKVSVPEEGLVEIWPDCLENEALFIRIIISEGFEFANKIPAWVIYVTIGDGDVEETFVRNEDEIVEICLKGL